MGEKKFGRTPTIIAELFGTFTIFVVFETF
jgi:hypothetical protein